MKTWLMEWQFNRFFRRWGTPLLLLSIIFFKTNSYAALQGVPLSLQEATQLALAHEPGLQRIQSNAAALNQQSIADGQLSDPQLMFGAINVPTNTFSFNQDDMTMIEVGVQQVFSPGHSRAIKSHQTQSMAVAEQLRYQEQRLALIRDVQTTWLNLYYWTQATRVIQKNRMTFAYLVKSVKSQFSANKTSLSDVTQAELELSRLDDQSLQITQQIDQLKAQLERWIGLEAERPLTPSLPTWPLPPSPTKVVTQLQQHLLLQIDAANIQAARDEVALAKEQYKPGITAGVSYGFRQGDMANGMPRSDMITGQVTVDLPVFTGQRQDRRLKAGEYRLEAAELEQQAHYRDLLKEFQTQYSLWQQLSKRELLYQKQLVPEAAQNAKAALLAYQSATEDLATVLRAHNNLLTIQLEQLQVQVERIKVRAALFYLQGHMP